MQVFEIIGIGIVIALILLCAACSFGRAPQSGRVRRRSRPDTETVDGFGGTRGWDESYSPGIRDAAGPFPVGKKVERDKTETHEAYSKDDDDY